MSDFIVKESKRHSAALLFGVTESCMGGLPSLLKRTTCVLHFPTCIKVVQMVKLRNMLTYYKGVMKTLIRSLRRETLKEFSKVSSLLSLMYLVQCRLPGNLSGILSKALRRV